MAEFGGWEMPIQYGGVVEEHTAVRESVGMFDVSHLGNVQVVGPGAKDFVNACFSNDIDRIGEWQAQYTLCCDDATGGVVDDLIVYRAPTDPARGDDLHLVPNAANAAEVVRRLREAAPAGIEITDRHDRHAIIAVQGPRSPEVLAGAGLEVDLDYMAFTIAERPAGQVVVCRTGYTGEHGYELVVDADAATELWDALLEAGEQYDVQPCGLGARDTLRTEMGYPLHGQDLSLDITPVQARCGWAVGWSKPAFWGRDTLAAEREAGARRLLWGLRATDRGIPRPHMTVRSADGSDVGEVTSGTFSPTLQRSLGLAYVPSELAEPGSAIDVVVRDQPRRATVVPLPHYAHRTRRPARTHRPA
jgi:aminomethyltransferase